MYNKSINDCDDFTTNREAVASNRLLERLTNKYSTKPYNEAFKGLRIATIGLSYLINFLSIGTAFSCIYLLLTNFAALNKTASIVATLGMLSILELLKRFTIPKTVELYLTKNKISIGFIAVSLLLILLSASISYKGTKDLISQNTANLNPIDSIKADYQNRIAKLEIEVSNINNGNSYKYKGRINRTGRKRIEYLQNRISSLEAKQDDNIEVATKQNRIILAEFNNDMEKSKQSLSLVAVVLDLLLLICLAYLEVYDYYSYIDLKMMTKNSAINNSTETNNTTKDTPTVSTTTTVAPTDNNNSVNNLTVKCLNCDETFERRNARKKYCSTKCRLEAYHKRTGQNLKIASKFS